MSQRLIRAMRGNIVAWLALFVAMGGTSLAASHYVITSTKQIKPSLLKKLKGSKGTRGLQGLQGPKGLQGLQGVQGPVGSVNTSNFFSKTESDGRYLGKTEQATDAAKLAGVPASGYTSGQGSQGGRWQELVNGGSEASFLLVPGIGELATKCNSATNATGVKLTEEAGSTVFLTWGSYPDKQPVKMETDVLKEGNPSLEQSFGATEFGTGQMVIQASAGLTTSLHTFATVTVSSSVTEGFCRFQANYTVAQQRF